MSFSGTKGWITKPPPGSVEDPFHPLSQGSVCHLLMNEGSGSRVYDISGHGNHGRLTNMAPNVQGSGWGGSKFGGGLQFDGVNDYVDCGSGSSLDITGDMTIGVWVYLLAKAGANYQIVSKRDNSSFTMPYMIGVDWGSFYFQLGTGTNSFGPYYSAELNKWQYVVGTISGNDIKLYVDGILKSTDTFSGTRQTNSVSVTVGSNAGNPPANVFNGTIDSVRIYNRALSAEEIKILYHDPFCNLLRVPVRYVPAAPEIIELLTTISATTSTSAPNVLMLRELASTIAATTSVSAADVDVLRELTSTIVVTTLLSDIELLTEQLRELVTTIATVTSTSTPEMKVLRELTSTIVVTTLLSDIELLTEQLRELVTTIATVTSTSTPDMNVRRELEAIIEATTALSAIELAISVWITSNPTITRLKSEGWFE